MSGNSSSNPSMRQSGQQASQSIRSDPLKEAEENREGPYFDYGDFRWWNHKGVRVEKKWFVENGVRLRDREPWFKDNVDRMIFMAHVGEMLEKRGMVMAGGGGASFAPGFPMMGKGGASNKPTTNFINPSPDKNIQPFDFNAHRFRQITSSQNDESVGETKSMRIVFVYDKETKMVEQFLAPVYPNLHWSIQEKLDERYRSYLKATSPGKIRVQTKFQYD